MIKHVRLKSAVEHTSQVFERAVCPMQGFSAPTSLREIAQTLEVIVSPWSGCGKLQHSNSEPMW